MGNFDKFLRLSWSDRWLLLRLLVVLPLAAFALRWLGWGNCLALLASTVRRTTEFEPTSVIIDRAQRLARLVRIAATQHVFSANCLQRTVVLWWLLQRRGVPSEIRFGACARAHGPEMHAWVECAGQVIGDRSDIRERFAPFGSEPLGDASIAVGESWENRHLPPAAVVQPRSR